MDITSIFNEDASIERTIRNIKKSLEYSLKEKYGIEDQEIVNSMMNVHGLSKDKFDIVSNVEKIIASHINDSSIDANSNKNTKTVESTFQETFLPFKKAIGYDYLYKTMKEMYGKKEAKRLAGEMYDMSLIIADSTSLLKPYCYAMNAQFINVEGRKWGTLYSKPAKRLSSYISALCETVHEMSNELAGACLYKNQELIYKKNNRIYSTKIEDIIKEYTLNNKYSNYQGEWEYSNVENLDVLENEGNFVKVNKIMRRKYNDDIYEIKTKSGKSVRVSKDHIFKVLFKGREIEVKAKDLQLYDTVFNTQIYGLPINKESQDYKDGQFYGILAGDGEITPKYCNRIAINYKQKFIADFLDDYLVDSNKTLLDGNGCFSYNIYGKDICSKIKETFNGSYCYDKELKNIEEKPLDFLVGFLDGILATDGTYNNSISIGLVNKKLIDNIKTILKKMNIQCSERVIKENKEKNKKEMYFLNIPYKVTQFLSLTNCKINKTKKDKTSGLDIPYYGNQAFSHSSSLWTSNKCKTYGKRDILKHLPNTDVIVEINVFSNDSEYVYEIETESHWYSVGGLLTHNCAISTFFFDSFHVLQLKENISLNEIIENKSIRKYIENEFQQFVHSVNHLSRNASESPFTNLSIFDSVKLRYMIEEMKWYFGEYNTEYVIDYVMELQKIFIEFFDKGDPAANGRPYRFPIITICFSKKVNGTDKIEDKKFLDYVSKKDIYRYNIFVSEGTKIASCCFSKDQKVLCRNENNIPEILTFEEAYNKYTQKKKFRVISSGTWNFANIVKIEKNNRKMFKIVTKNNKEMILSEDHINITYNGEKRTNELSIDDYIMFNTSKLSEVCENTNSLSYEQGILIGVYIGDGSGAFGDSSQIALSLNSQKYNMLSNHLKKAMKTIDADAFISIGEEKNNSLPITINSSRRIKEFIQKYCYGERCNTKKILMNVLFESEEFRRGIIDGLYETDGGNSNRIYSVSKDLIESMEVIFTSLGIISTVDISDRTDEKVIIRNEEYNRNYPLYCIRWYSESNKQKYDDVYKKKLNSIFFKIKEISEYDYNYDYIYCFEMKNKDNPYFVLPTGIVTHNCRLISDTEMMDMASSVNSFGGSGISMGSHRVVTIDFTRIALESKTIEEYYNLIKERTESTTKILKAHKHLIETLAEKGLQKFITNGIISMKRMFSTYGIIGLVEAQEIIKKKFFIEEDIISQSLTLLNELAKEYSNKYGIIVNIEQIPGETVAQRALIANNVIFNNTEYLKDYHLFSNQFVPLWKEATIYERLEADGKYNRLITGGGIVHAQIGEKITSTQAKEIINYAVECGCEHFALNSVYSQCKNNHNHFGKLKICPTCNDEIVEYFTRVVGFFVPVSSWIKERREWEFDERKFV